ncbi:hypothetical protein IW261DRAFT_1574221 [Armillaria novae-zelandiae]|uniref:Uncharacterized protein n=1 Tax=Armillaria novae-zelandiae TaxID=153914 RepID=A0AA39T6A3_9AGAR|nr:hypothetical protein IW261DRAFT_1574221 [Armillaria novae-zelandiae]
MAQPTDPQELSVVVAQDRYKTAAIELCKLLATPLLEDANVSTINLWVINGKVHWECCTQYWHQAKVTSLEWHKLEYKLLEVFLEVPDNLVLYSCMEYNELAKRARQFSMDVVPVPTLQMPSRPSIPKESTPSTAPLVLRSFVIPPSPDLAASHLPQALSLVRSCPILNKNLATTPAVALTSAAIFRLDSDSPLHPHPSTVLGPSVTKSVAPSEGSVHTSQQLQVVNAASHPQVLPGPDPTREGSVAFISHGHMPLFFLGTDDKEEVITPDAIDKGKEKAVSPSFDDEDEDLQSQEPPSNLLDANEDDDASPPPTNLAYHLRSPWPSGPPYPPSATEVRPLHEIHQADPNSTLFKLLGAPVNKKHKRASWKYSKFNNPPGSPLDSAIEGTAMVARSAGKTAKTTLEVDKIDVVATKVHRPRGPSRIHPPLATMGVQGGGFCKEVPAGYKAIPNGLKSIGILVVSQDFGNFIEVDKALWNKKVAPFIGEQYVQLCDQCHHRKTQCCKFLTNSVLCVCCHYTKLPCQVNKVAALNPIHHYRPKEYESINAFESAMTALTQHANNLEDVIVNYMAGLDAMSQLQGLRTQISHLCECLGSDTQVEEIVEEDDDEGYNAGEVAKGEAGPLRKRKRSQK